MTEVLKRSLKYYIKESSILIRRLELAAHSPEQVAFASLTLLSALIQKLEDEGKLTEAEVEAIVKKAISKTATAKDQTIHGAGNVLKEIYQKKFPNLDQK